MTIAPGNRFYGVLPSDRIAGSTAVLKDKMADSQQEEEWEEWKTLITSVFGVALSYFTLLLFQACKPDTFEFLVGSMAIQLVRGERALRSSERRTRLPL